MAKTTEKYELMYIINPNLSEEETAAVVEKFKALVEQNGTLEEMEEMGKRKLAYEINYISEGYYVLVKFTSGPRQHSEPAVSYLHGQRLRCHLRRPALLARQPDSAEKVHAPRPRRSGDRLIAARPI